MIGVRENTWKNMIPIAPTDPIKDRVATVPA